MVDPDAVCAGCHRQIYEKYVTTPMGQGSGLATMAPQLGEFKHAPSGVSYRIFLRGGALWMSYERVVPAKGQREIAFVKGERKFELFVGSGHRGRTYLYEESGQWFESPINYYAKKQIWDMAPNYERSRTMPGSLPVDSNCLHCHASEVQTALPQARNRYASEPFLQAGIGCSACHGDASEHLASGGRLTVVNPAILETARRDSVCLQCHLEGDATVYKAGKSLAEFRAGDDLWDDAVYFVKASEGAGGARATSQYEALLRSACMRASGNKLTCTTCHDPHGTPDDQDRAGFFRARCLSCHKSPELATRHHPEQQDCATCHMPTRKTSDISHEQVTDHDIEKRPAKAGEPLQLSTSDAVQDLVPVGDVAVGDREKGLAYAQMVEHGNGEYAQTALATLRRAEAHGADDAELHTQIGYLEQLAGERKAAAPEYRTALKEDAFNSGAAGDLAVLEASSGHGEEAARLLQRIVAADPSLTVAGVDLAILECSAGMEAEVSKLILQLLKFNPDDPSLRVFINSNPYRKERCATSSSK